MIQKEFKLVKTNEKLIEKVIIDENVNYLHMVLPKGEGLPIHQTNANLYMTVIRGTLNLGLNDQAVLEYETGTVINIPSKTTMNARNTHDAVLELIVVKAPAPGKN
jgi:quercetin dioxygenase-like cupin family protein